MRTLVRVLTACVLALALLAPAGCTRRPAPPASEPPSAEVPAAPTGLATETLPATGTASAPETPPATPRPQPEPETPSDDEESKRVASASAVALEAARKSGGQRLGELSVGRTRLARDDDGWWWASVLITCSKPGVDPLPVFLKGEGGVWEVLDIGTGVEPPLDERFPAEVRQKL